MFNSSQGNNFTSGSGGGGGNQQGGGQQRRMNPIRPVTIKQLLEAQSVGQGAMVIDGREVTQATVVGRVVAYESANLGAGQALTAKHHGYRITDNTGMVTVRQWVDTDTAQEPLPLNSHVRASGSVKVWQDAPVVTGTVVAMADSNEMNFHMLDAVLTHLRLAQGDKRPAADSATGASVQNSSAAVGVQNVLPGGNTTILLTDLLYNAIKQSGGGGGMGMTMDELTVAVQRYNFGPTDVRAAMRTLSAEGKAYQTHDNRFNV